MLIFGVVLNGIAVVNYFVSVRVIAIASANQTIYVSVIVYSNFFPPVFQFSNRQLHGSWPDLFGNNFVRNYYFLGEKEYWLYQPANLDAYGFLSTLSFALLLGS